MSSTSQVGGDPTAGSKPVEEAKEAMREAAGTARRQGGRLMDEAKGIAGEVWQERREAAAGEIGSVAGALRRSADHLRSDEHGLTARYVSEAADGLQRLSEAVRGRDVRDLIAEVEDFARRQPAVFVGGAVAAGFILSRFLKSSDRLAGRRGVETAGDPAPSGPAYASYGDTASPGMV
jgi:hypothetical protein